MKVDILNISKDKVGEINLPIQFEEDIREDLVKRAALAMQSNRKQRYGAMPEAGKRSSSTISKRRRKYRGSYGLGISRTPRKILSRRGARMFWVGAFSPNTVGGRRAHPPKSEKKLQKKINKKERKKALRVGISATVIRDLVKSRGHMIPENYPFVLDKNFENLKKTKDVREALKNFGFENELERVGKKNIRAGRGKARGRRYKIRKGPLIIVSKQSEVMKATDNLLGIDIVNVKNLNIAMLAPGKVPGRLTLWTQGAIETLEKERLFR